MAKVGMTRRGLQVASIFTRHMLGRSEPLPRRLKTAFAELGPTFVKVGQVISSSPGLFPPEWIQEFGSLLDRVPPFPGDEARKIVEQDLRRPLSSVFSKFEDEPIAAASIAQVHPATLLDGREVVVKIQRLGLDLLVRQDLRALLLLCEVLERVPQTAIGSPRALAEDFARTLHEEMDFRLEADNMDRMRHLLVQADIRDARVPEVHWRFVARRVLTMERLDGFRFQDVSAMRAAGIDTVRLLGIGVQTVVEGVLLYGFFHGDLHAGNIAVLPDGTFVLYDFGIVGRLTESVRARLAQYLMALTTRDYAGMIRALRAFGSLPKGADVDELATEVRRLYESYLEDGVVVAQLGQLMDTTIRAMVRHHVRIPRELVLLTKQMLYLEGAAHTLAPDADLLQEQQLIYQTLLSKYPDLATEIMQALARSAEVDEVLSSREASDSLGGAQSL